MPFYKLLDQVVNSTWYHAALVRLTILGLSACLVLAAPWFSVLIESVVTQPNSLVAQLVWLLDLAANWQSLASLTAAIAGVLWFFRCLCAPRRVGFWHWVPLVFLPLAILPLFGLGAAVPGPPVADAPREAIDSTAGLASDTTAAKLRVAHINLHFTNTDPTALERWLVDMPVDVLVIHELSPDVQLNAKVFAHLPHRALYPSDNPFGVGVLSRFPIRLANEQVGLSGAAKSANAPAFRPQRLAGSSLRIEVTSPTGNFRISAVHPIPPLSPELRASRDELLFMEADWLAGGWAIGVPGLLVGDFNATVWTTAFRRLAPLGLRRVCGLAATWPAVTSQSIGLGIGIDHILATDGWLLNDCGTGPKVGSDHLPIWASLRRKP